MKSIRFIALAGLTCALLADAACNGTLQVDEGHRSLTGTAGEDGGADPSDASAGDAVDAALALPRWLGNPADCPTDPVTLELPCEVSEGEFCAYRTEDAATGSTTYRACACRAASSTSLLWACGPPEFYQGPCPAVQPVQGSDCYGFYGQQCPYPPNVECECSADTGWRCTAEEPEISSEHPTTLDEAKRVADLTDAERQAWCEWFIGVTGRSGFPELEPTADGYYPSSGCAISREFYCDGMMPTDLPVFACVDNLSLSSCTAPVSELSDCALTLVRGGWPAPYGCARYFEVSGCSGTIVIGAGAVATDGGSVLDVSDCKVRVQ